MILINKNRKKNNDINKIKLKKYDDDKSIIEEKNKQNNNRDQLKDHNL